MLRQRALFLFFIENIMPAVPPIIGHRSHWSLPLLGWVLIVTTGCMPLWTGRDLQDEVAQLEARQVELEQEAHEREVTLAMMIDEARHEIEELERVMEEARSLLARDSADLGAELRAIREDIARVRGNLEELQFLHRRQERAFETFRKDMDQRFVGVEPEELLEKAQTFLEDQEYGLARRALTQFLDDYEDHPLASEARLDLGEVHFQTGQWESAGSEFDRVRMDSTSQARQARATRRIAEVFWRLGDCDSAELFFESVIDDFPRSEEVGPARDGLRAVKGGQCPRQ